MVDAVAYHERTNHTEESLRATDYRMDPSIKPRPYKIYRGCPREDLPEVRAIEVPALEAISHAGAEGATDRSTSLDASTLATICYIANGIAQRTTHQGEEVYFRTASCTGKLYHIDIYLVTGELDPLPAGIYHFDPRSFSLDVLRQGDFRGDVVSALGRTPSGQLGSAEVYAICTSTWWRNAWKYRARTYRHAFWDGGTLIANLLAGAHGQGIAAQVITGFVDDDVANLVGVDFEEEAPIAMVALGTDATIPEPRAPDPLTLETEAVSSDRIEFPLIVDAWRQSTLEDTSAVDRWRQDVDGSGSIRPVTEANGQGVSVEPVDAETATARPLLATVKRRGSKRAFVDRGPSRRQLGTVLDRALRGVPGDWNGGVANGSRYLEFFVLATGVDGIDDGAYRYDRTAHTLEHLGPVERSTKTRLALNQSWAGEAQVNVYCMADVAAIVDALGNRGYRLVQLEAGITLGRLYLATAAHRSLGGTGLTFFDEQVQEFLSPVVADALPMTLFALGRIDTTDSS